MKYLCLIYGSEADAARMTPEEGHAEIGEYHAFTQDIARSGHLKGGEALEMSHTATVVRVRNGKVHTTDGPFAETKEQLGGFYLIDAKDLNDALQVAARIPGARVGAIEVRPCMAIPDM